MHNSIIRGGMDWSGTIIRQVRTVSTSIHPFIPIQCIPRSLVIIIISYILLITMIIVHLFISPRLEEKTDWRTYARVSGAVVASLLASFFLSRTCDFEINSFKCDYVRVRSTLPVRRKRYARLIDKTIGLRGHLLIIQWRPEILEP